MPIDRLPLRLTPLAARHGLRPFYGDIHNHCALSSGHGSLTQALKRARRQLDFASVTGHASWPDMPVGDPSVAHIVAFHVKGFARLRDRWPGHFEELAAADESGAFTVFPGYEIHSSEHGDYTIVYRDLEPRPILEAGSPGELARDLTREFGAAAFAFPHHIGYRQGARGINWNAFNSELSPVVEIVSMHGCSETSLTDRPFLHSMGPSDGHSTVRHGLGLGFQFGFLGNTDHHSAYPGSYGHGRSAVYAPDNSRSSLWDAFRRRRTNALTGDNSHLFFTIGGEPQGGRIAAHDNPAIELEAVGGSFIDYIDVVRNERVVARVSPELHPDPVDGTDPGLLETILVLELGWGARGSFHDWRGSIELRGGDILAVEPRLRGPEVVSPLEGDADGYDDDHVAVDGNLVSFAIRSFANPNNATSATQAIAARIRVDADASLRLSLDGRQFDVSVSRLLHGAFSANLGPIDSPAFRLHPLPEAHQWQWRGTLLLEPLRSGDRFYVRMRQANGQWTWASPVFCE